MGYIDSYCLYFLLLVIGIGFTAYLFTQYEASRVIKAVVGIFVGIILSVLLARFYMGNAERFYDEERVFPAVPWRQIKTIKTPVTQFVYRADKGLFITTSAEDLLLATGVSDCDGNNWHSPFQDIQQGARLTLPPPPGKPIATISFHIPIQNEPEVDTIVWGATAFAIYENGEVWCTEREVQRGQSMGAGAAAGMGFNWFCITGLGAMLSLAIALKWLEKKHIRHKTMDQILPPWYLSRSALGRLLRTRVYEWSMSDQISSTGMEPSRVMVFQCFLLR